METMKLVRKGLNPHLRLLGVVTTMVDSRTTLFSQVMIGVAASLAKNGSGPHFSIEERTQMLRESIVELGIDKGVEIRPFSGLLMDLCRTIGADGVVKGLHPPDKDTPRSPTKVSNPSGICMISS